MITFTEKYNIKTKFCFRVTFQNKLFTESDEESTLETLCLVPNASLVMIQGDSTGTPMINTHQATPPTAYTSYVQLTWDYLSSWVYWFIGTTPAAPEQPTSFHGSSRGKVHHVSSVAEYNQLKNTNELVIVDVSAVWCGPCQRIAPYFEELSRKYTSVVFIHVDLDQFKNSISDLSDVKSVPTFKFFKNKKQVNVLNGANQQNLLQNLERYK